MTPHPVHEVASLYLVAPFGHDIEPAIDRQEHLTAAAMAGIGVVDRSVVVLVEVADGRGDPAELPAHPLTICLELCDRSARDRDKADVVMLEMLPRAVDLVREQRTAGASLLPLGTKHEVMDDKLTASVEQVAQRHRAVDAFEDIVLLDLDPGQGAALLRQAVPL